MRWAAVRLVGLVLAAIVVGAAPAAADPARPGNVSSTVTGVTPPTPSISAAIEGGDAFFRLTVAPGTSVTVLGYENEPYLRFGADGAVDENTRSPAVYLNRRRYAGDPVPPGASATATPEWRRVAGGGEYAWHDHRTHWMAFGRPPAPQVWHVPLLVNGTAVTIDGVYEGVPSPSPVGWWALAAVVGVAVVALGLRWRWVASAAAIVGGVVGLPVAVAAARLPQTGVNGWTGVALCVVAALAGLSAAAVRRPTTGGALLAGAGVALLLWAGRRLNVFDHAVLVTTLPAWLDRFSVAVGVGAGVALIVVGVRVVLAPPSRRQDVAAA